MMRIFLFFVLVFILFPFIYVGIKKLIFSFHHEMNEDSIDNKSKSIKRQQKEFVNDVKIEKSNLGKRQKEVEKIEKGFNK